MNELISSPNPPQAEQREQRDGSVRATNETDATDDSARSVQVPTIPEAVRLSLTEGITDKTLFKFARAIRAFEMTTGMRIKQSEVSNVFAEWWRTAQAEKLLPADASHDEYALLFEDTFARAKVPLGANALYAAIKRAEKASLPEAAKQFTDPKMQKLVGTCYQLQKLTGRVPFFLSVRDCAKIYGTKRLATASAILNGFVSRQILRIAKKGLPGGKLATRFWYGEAKGETPALVTSENVPKRAEEASPMPKKTGELSPTELILRQKELERVEKAMSKIADGYDSHQSWSKEDRKEYNRLKKRRAELIKILGMSA